MSLSFLNILLCGAFIFIPLATFAIGILLITRFLGYKSKVSTASAAFLIGVVFFEASLIGILADPRSIAFGRFNIFKTAGLIGLGVFVIALVFSPAYSRLLRLFKH